MSALKGIALLFAVACHGSYYKTEPTFFPEIFNTSHVTEDKSLLAPGYLFLEPLVALNAWGPQIYAQDGTLIFAGGHRRVQDFKRCDYLGEEGNHICFHQSRFDPNSDPRIQKRASDEAPRPVGKKVILDNTYTQVGKDYIKGIGEGETKNWPNGHEYNMLKGGESFLQAVYKPTPWDLREYAGEQDGYILDGCFQEISVRTADVIFEWCYADHFELWQSNLFFDSPDQKVNETSNKGGYGTAENPWDFVHLNAVDKTSEGDYIVSGRHLDQVFKLAGPANLHGLEPGSLIWRVGGKSNEFEMEGDFIFTKQHDVRHISTTATETTISFYNNAWEGTNEPSAERSAGMIIAINNSTMKARVLREYPHPDGILGRAMGSMQVLPNGNALLGWGAAPQITEFSEDGTVLWHAWYNLPNWDERKDQPGVIHEWTYRTFKFPWIGKPHWGPKLLAYSLRCTATKSAPFVAYVSWNGATEVVKWRFFVSQSETGPWLPAGTLLKDGFETKVELSGTGRLKDSRFMPWVAAEALGQSDVVLGRTVNKTFVPIASMREHCNARGCHNGHLAYKYPAEDSCATACEHPTLVTIALFALVLLSIEAISFLASMMCRLIADVELDGGIMSSWRSLRSGEAFGDAPYRFSALESANSSIGLSARASGREKPVEG